MSSRPATGPDETPWSIATTRAFPPLKRRRRRISFPVEDIQDPPCECVARTLRGRDISTLRCQRTEIDSRSRPRKDLDHGPIVSGRERHASPREDRSGRPSADFMEDLRFVHAWFRDGYQDDRMADLLRERREPRGCVGLLDGDETSMLLASDPHAVPPVPHGGEHPSEGDDIRPREGGG